LTGIEALPTTLQHSALTVKRILGASINVRKYFQIVGFSSPANYLVHNSSINNLARGVLTRVFYVKGKTPPKPRDGIYSERLLYFSKLLWRKLPPTTPVSRQNFVDFYKGRRKILYQKACDSLLRSGISHKDAQIKAFVKAEFINSDDKPDPDPRVISPRDPRYNVEVGKYLRPIEHKVYGAIADIFGEPTVLKGYNAQSTGKIFHDKWKKYRKPVAIGLDASRFDQHVSVNALKWEHSIYNGIFRTKELKKLLRWQLKNRVSGYCRDGKLRYNVDGCRMSGDMNTAMGNCLIMCALVHAYLKLRGIRGSLANNGDDCVVIIESHHLDSFTNGLDEWFLEMGFNMKVEKPVYEMEGIEFCQTHPIYIGGSYLMVRNFPKAIAKDCLSLKTLDSPLICKSWMAAVGEGGLSLTGGIPVYQDFYSSYVRSSTNIPLGRNKKIKVDVELTGGIAWLSKGMNLKYSKISPETRFSFYLAFGITPDAQMELEGYYRKQNFNYSLVNLERQRNLPDWFSC